MVSRTQITLDPEMQRRARRRANDLGVSFAEYVRNLLERDLGGASLQSDPSLVFDLGRSAGSNISTQKDAMIAQAMSARPARKRRR